ncbi:molybdate ABC transporter substrate-binding protein [Microbacterium sp. 2FI]|uniref:molybdate ABC transporter substrate-binding protein n=1 Tax=Microbacterium sp. 2FI TaxID=2502193 RepID=UPI0020163036|nr:molybdate ABC transporter substrate-binding protein [Microbacterium sp. 2FI]
MPRPHGTMTHEHPRPRRHRVLFVAASLALALTGCAAAGSASPDEQAMPGDPTATNGAELSGELTIWAAASLGAVFEELATGFEGRHPGVEVLPISYDGSSTLATQLIEGAPADVFASADEATMQRVVDAGIAASPRLFASNTLVIAVPAGNPGTVQAIEDLGSPELTVVLCAPAVPCGAASITLLADNGVSVTPASIEQNVTAVLAKVAAGEADAGLVYVTDVRNRDDVEAIPAAGSEDVVGHYPIAALEDAADPEIAAAFVDFVLSEPAQALLASRGFGPP